MRWNKQYALYDCSVVAMEEDEREKQDVKLR